MIVSFRIGMYAAGYPRIRFGHSPWELQYMGNAAGSEKIWSPLTHDMVDGEVLRAVSGMVSALPDLPLSVKGIVDTVSREDVELREVVELISSDPPLVSNILKVVNSSYYGLSHKTDNLQLAIVLLGFIEVKKIAIRSSVSRILDSGQSAGYPDTKHLWVHSYLVSACIEIFADADSPQSRGDLTTIGLLHDIGKFVLITIADKLKGKGLLKEDGDSVPEDAYLLRKEEALFGINHAIVGGMLARKWNLSDRFVSVLECHHYPSFFGASAVPEEYERDISAVSIADCIVNRFNGGETQLPQPHPHFFEILGYEPEIGAMMDDTLIARLNYAGKYLDTML